jgi:hypothetical protein
MRFIFFSLKHNMFRFQSYFDDHNQTSLVWRRPEISSLYRECIGATTDTAPVRDGKRKLPMKKVK